MLLGFLAACGSDDSSDEPEDTGAKDKDGGDDSAGDTDSETEEDTEELDTEATVVTYEVSVNGEDVPVTRMYQLKVPVNYVLLDHDGASLDIEVKAESDIEEFTLSPKSKNLEATASDDTLTFSVDEPGYLVLQIKDQERLFILIDEKEDDPPEIGDSNVRNLMDYDDIDNKGREDMTELLQAAVDEASGSDRNILYVPAGTYAIETLTMKDDMTLYLEKGALLKNITTKGNLLSQPEELTLIEGRSKGFIMMNGISNATIRGRGAIDGNGSNLSRKMFLIKIQHSSDCHIDGIVSRNSPFWNVMIYRSDEIHIANFKVINNRLDDKHNETDGVDFNNCTNSTLTNAFLYTGDDCMAVKSDDIQDDLDIDGLGDPTEDGSGYIAVDNIVHEKIVCFSGSAACKVGTKTFGESMSNVVFRDVDVITTDRVLVIDAVDTANIRDTLFEDIRIEHVTGRLVDINMRAEEIYWRITPGVATVTNTTFKDVVADNSAAIRIEGVLHDWAEETDPYYGEEYYVNDVTFDNFAIEGTVLTSQEDGPFDVNDYVTGITFQE